MELSELVQYDKERCKREQPLLYLATYWGKDIEDRKKEDFWVEKKKRPMRFIVGKLDVVYDLRGKPELHLPPEKLEYSLDPPLLTIDLQKRRRKVCWENIVCIDILYAGDFVTLNREEYEHEVKERIQAWKDDEFYDSCILPLLNPFFLLVHELEKQHRAPVSA